MENEGNNMSEKMEEENMMNKTKNLKEHFEDEEYNLIRVECDASKDVEILQNQIDKMNDFIRQTRIDLFERTAINREDLNAMRENHAELQPQYKWY